MLIQILEEYNNRTEYRLLKDFYNCQVVSLESLQSGSLVLPGILLSRLSTRQLNSINEWLGEKGNQLILTPSWVEINLEKLFHTSVDIEISRVDEDYEGIPIQYEIITSAKDVIYENKGKCYGIHYRKNTGAGLITVVTLPLLDYKLIRYEIKLKNMMNTLFQMNPDRPYLREKTENFILSNLHVYLIILSGAQVDLSQQLSKKIHYYFGVHIDEEIAEQRCKELINHQIIDLKGLMSKGLMIVKERKLKSFIKVVKQRGENEYGWE